ncbi:MAG: hypothetical protein HQL95_07150 [Magnetococcales bacterium]|nr:hypothetical protein [Magnetococcales bacterium]
MANTIPLTVVWRGFRRLNLILSPLSISLLVYLGIMGGGSSQAPGMIWIFATVAACIFLVPAALVLFHVGTAKLLDGLLDLIPFSKAEISWPGILVAALLVVILGNVLVDDLYQFRQGNYGISWLALGLDIGGMAAVVTAGGGNLPAISPQLRP